MLNGAWRNFWSDPASYHRWEAEAVQELFSPCGEPGREDVIRYSQETK